MNEVARFLVFAATIFPAIIVMLALMTRLESDLDDPEAEDRPDR